MALLLYFLALPVLLVIFCGGISIGVVCVGILAHVSVSNNRPLETIGKWLPNVPNQPIESRADFKNNEAQASISKNEFSDFRITVDVDVDELDVLIADVWYCYDGALGSDDIFIEIEPVNNGASLHGTAPHSCLRKKVEIIRHNALAKNVIYNYVLFSCYKHDEEESTHIQVSLLHNDTCIYQQLFPYKRKWNVQSTAQDRDKKSEVKA